LSSRPSMSSLNKHGGSRTQHLPRLPRRRQPAGRCWRRRGFSRRPSPDSLCLCSFSNFLAWNNLCFESSHLHPRVPPYAGSPGRIRKSELQLLARSGFNALPRRAPPLRSLSSNVAAPSTCVVHHGCLDGMAISVCSFVVCC
jgi:hypothetical protein